MNKIFQGIVVDALIVIIGALINGWSGAFCALSLVSYIKVVTMSFSNPMILELLKKLENVERDLKNNAEFAQSLQNIAKEMKE